MSYIDLCSRVFSHIQSKDIREYYINEIRDSFNPNQIMILIRNGFYSLEEKFKDIKELSEYTSYSNDLESLSANFIELSDIEKDYYDNDNVLYSGSFHEALYNYDDTLSYNGQRLYGRTFDEIICNTDRHFGNFGLLIDNKTNRIIAPAPLFDHGNSLFNLAGKDVWDSD